MIRTVPALRAIGMLRCPRCGATPVFKPWRRLRSIAQWFDTEPGCPRCEYCFEREPGYFLMATWGVVFFPAALLGVALMFLLPRLHPMNDAWLLCNACWPTALFAVAISRHARVLFMAVDHLFDPPGEADRAAWRKLAGPPAGQ